MAKLRITPPRETLTLPNLIGAGARAPSLVAETAMWPGGKTPRNFVMPQEPTKVWWLIPPPMVTLQGTYPPVYLLSRHSLFSSDNQLTEADFEAIRATWALAFGSAEDTGKQVLIR